MIINPFVFASAAPAWDPSSLSSPPKVWLDDSSSVTAVSGNASQWNDKSGNDSHVQQSTTTQQPLIVPTGLNGRRTLRFDGTNDVMISTTTVSKQITKNANKAWMFSVYSKTLTDTTDLYRTILKCTVGTSDNDRMTMYAGQASPLRNVPSIGARRLDADTFMAYGRSTAFAGAFTMFFHQVDWSTGQGSISINGDTITSGTVSSTGSTSNTDSQLGVCVGAGRTNGGFPGDIEIACGLVGSGAALTQTDIDKLFGWAAWRYGLTGLLPSGHPYKTSPP